ncbi:MAG TPA: glycosyltransferase [Vicinamibacterales bacterium]|nr:glycosyltransferase [Vicinamibacterales bacterium]
MPGLRVPAVVFLTSFDAGGTERQMIELVRRLDRQRFTVHVACFRREGEWRERAEELAESVVEFPVPRFHSAAAVRQAGAFARWCRRERIVVLQAGDRYANTFALPAAALAGVPVRVGSRREINPDKRASHIAAQRLAFAFAHRVVANSGAARRRLRAEGVPARRVSLIPNGVDLEAFHPSAPREQLRHVVTVSRFRAEKSIDTFIEAGRLALAREPGLDFTIVGDGPLGGALRAQAAATGLGERFHFLGHREDVAGVLRASDLFVLASRSEAFPNAVIEAMATALPVVATRVGGIPELIEHGERGLLVTPGRPEELAAAILELVRQPSIARMLGGRAREHAVATYSFERMVGQFEALYEELTAGRRLGAASYSRAVGAR